jgi:Zn-dependent protease with chaperone function
MSDIKTTQVEFTGKASEYCGIWIVNLLSDILSTHPDTMQRIRPFIVAEPDC